jgi:hypothetical protein
MKKRILNFRDLSKEQQELFCNIKKDILPAQLFVSSNSFPGRLKLHPLKTFAAGDFLMVTLYLNDISYL